MYARALSPCRRDQRGDQNGAAVAGLGGSNTTANPRPAARTAADYRRGGCILPHLAHRRDAAPDSAFRRWADRKSEAGSRATLLPERDHVATDLPPLVRSAGGGLGLRTAPPPGRRRAKRDGHGNGQTVS